MSDDGNPPAKLSKYNLTSDSEHRKEASILETISRTQLLDLNEDCLNEIFGHLNVIELCYVSRVCKKFQQLAESYFKRKYSDFDFSTLFEAGGLTSNQEARHVLRVFGPMYTSITIPRQAFHNHEAIEHVEERILKDAANYCSDTLNSLKLTGFRFTSGAVQALNLLSGSLTKLTLDGSVSTDSVFHLINFTSLESLSLANSADCYALMDTFPNLNTLQLRKVSIHNLHHFIARHSQLKTLIIYNSTRVSSSVLGFVAKYGKNLRTLQFYENSINASEPIQTLHRNFLHLSELRNLKYLALSCRYLSFGNLLAKMVKNEITLKKLYISQGSNDDQTIDAIVQMKCLEQLTFFRMSGLNGEHLIKFAKKLTRLKRLKFYLVQDITATVLKDVLRHSKQLVLLIIYQTNFRLDSGLYNDILDIVKERRNGIKLELNLTGANMQILAPQATIQANENWLIIKQTRRNQSI